MPLQALELSNQPGFWDALKTVDKMETITELTLLDIMLFGDVNMTVCLDLKKIKLIFFVEIPKFRNFENQRYCTGRSYRPWSYSLG